MTWRVGERKKEGRIGYDDGAQESGHDEISLGCIASITKSLTFFYA